MTQKFYKRGLAVAVGLILAPCTIQAQSLADGLLNYWNFEDNAEDTASDFAGSTGTTDNDGTVSGDVTYTAGQTGFGQAGNFPGGAEDRIVVLDPDDETNDIDRTGANLTVSLWAQLTNRETAWQAIIGHGEGSDYRISLNRANNPVGIAYAGGGRDILSDGTIGPGPGGDGLWHHIAAVTDGTVSRLYLDGVLQSTGTVTGIAGNGGSDTNQLHIGSNPEVPGREWNGLIDDMAMWDRALTRAEIRLIFTTGSTGGADLSTILLFQDSDGDGLSNAWEEQFGLDPNDDGSVDINNGAVGDPDNDGSSNLDEQANGTSPLDDDSDDDGIFDGFETNRNPATWVSNTDTGTDPLNPDTDGDGIDDGAEAFDPIAMTGSDPTQADTDADGLPDPYEIDNGLDPQIDDSELDADGDTLTNFAEFESGTNPQSTDSDNDFSDDAAEIANGTDPLNPDSDFDTLLDGNELTNGTDPLLADSDGDGFNDNAEIALGTDPTNPNDTPLVSVLPIFDDFADEELNLTNWKTLNGGVSQDRDGTIFGGLVTEAGGGLNFESRGYLVTTAEFDPELTGGIEITGEFTFANGDDVFNILTRTDAVPSPIFGEAESGIRFTISGRSNVLDIDERGDDFTVENVLTTGALEFAVDTPYIFTVIDDGEGSLSMVVFERDDPTNTASITGDLIADSSDSNFIAFYNREGNRMSSIQDLSIISAVSNDLIEITEFIFDPTLGANGGFSITWSSNLDIEYSIFSSTDLVDWTTEVIDGIIGQDGTTTQIFANPQPGASRLFFRVGLPPL